MDQTELQPEFEFTPEQVQLLRQSAGGPLHVAVKETNRVYLVVEQGIIPTLDEDYIRQGLAKAAEDIAAGNVADWDVEEIKAAAREAFARRNSQT